MDDLEATIVELGNEPPISADGRNGPPDRREISARWLSGTFLTGVTSTILMGVALLAALDGREKLATPPEVIKLTGIADRGAAGEEAKTDRLSPPRQIARAKDRRRLEVPTVTRVGDRDVVRTMPFVDIRMALAAGHKTNRRYPPFDPFVVASEDGELPAAPLQTSITLDAKGETDMALRTVDFPLDQVSFEATSALSADEVEEIVRKAAQELADGAVQVAALHYVDPQRFGASDAEQALASYGVRIVQENVSVAVRAASDQESAAYAEDIIPFTQDRRIRDAFVQSGYEGEDALDMAGAISKLLNTEALRAGTVLRVGLMVQGDEPSVVRASVYDRTTHLLTIALDDDGQLVPANEPEPNPAIASAFDDSPPVQARGELPTIYDGIYQAAYSYGMSAPMTKKLIRLLAADVDFQARVSPSDRLEVFFSQPDGDDRMSEDSELLYVAATFGGTTRHFYRFRMKDGTIDYFDEEGRSARQFLLRTPVPTGQFRSGFGARRHPILGYVRMHTGVDWSAPVGTPIIAAGNGVVEKAGWSGGYGRQTIIRHPNGYVTSYNHQSAIAPWVKPGVRVRQGQVIGYVGASGLATGAHLHYELIVNGTKVDPMRVRLPSGKVLAGEELEAFKQERDRINQILDRRDDYATNVASARLTN